MSKNSTDWVAEKISSDQHVRVVDRTADDLLVVESRNGYQFPVAVIGVQNVIGQSDVQPLWCGATEPKLVINVPSRTLWRGDAIRFVHDRAAAFGTMGDIYRAATTGDAGSYRDKSIGFFINAIKQHTNVSDVSYLYDRVLQVSRHFGASLTVAVVDAYNLSAEDVRNAKTMLGHFDIVVKSSSHGSITHQATAAASSMGAEALTFRELMGRLAK